MVSRTFQNLTFVVAAFLSAACTAEAASVPAKKPPAEVAIVSMPPTRLAQPAEVKVTAMPVVQPPQVTVNVPKDESAAGLAKATWGLLIANVVLALATFCGSWWQSRDTKRRDRDAMMREVSRAAHKVMVTVTRLRELAKAVPTTRTQLHILCEQGGLPPGVKEQTEKDLLGRLDSLNGWNDEASFVVTDQPDAMAPILRLSDKALATRLWRLDTLQVRLDGMREDITKELERYETESATRRQQQTALQAASLNAHLSKPLKSKLGE